MLNFSFLFACLACVGRGRRVQTSAWHQQPAAAFNPASLGGARRPAGNPAVLRPEVLERQKHHRHRVSLMSTDDEMKEWKKETPKGVKLGELAKAQAPQEEQGETEGVQVTIKTPSSKSEDAAATESAAPAPVPWFEETALSPAPPETSAEKASPDDMNAEVPAQESAAPVEMSSEAPTPLEVSSGSPAPSPATPAEISSEVLAPVPTENAEATSDSLAPETSSETQAAAAMPAAATEASSEAPAPMPASSLETSAEAPAPMPPTEMSSQASAPMPAEEPELAPEPPVEQERAPAPPADEQSLATALAEEQQLAPAAPAAEVQAAPVAQAQEEQLVPAAQPEGTGMVSADEEQEMEYMQIEDFLNTKWKVEFKPYNTTRIFWPGSERTFVLLQDGSVIWPDPGKGGGLGTGGRWEISGSQLNVNRYTCWGNSLGLFLGLDTYVAEISVDVTEDLQFRIKGFVRTYNAYMPFFSMGEFVAVRQPGRFIVNTDDDS